MLAKRSFFWLPVPLSRPIRRIVDRRGWSGRWYSIRVHSSCTGLDIGHGPSSWGPLRPPLPRLTAHERALCMPQQLDSVLPAMTVAQYGCVLSLIARQTAHTKSHGYRNCAPLSPSALVFSLPHIISVIAFSHRVCAQRGTHVYRPSVGRSLTARQLEATRHMALWTGVGS